MYYILHFRTTKSETCICLKLCLLCLLQTTLLIMLIQLYSEKSDNYLKYTAACIIPGHSTMHGTWSMVKSPKVYWLNESLKK